MTKRPCLGAAQRRGGILLLLVLLLPAIILLVGLAVDVSYVQLNRTEMRMAVDAASRAAADELARTDSKQAARAKAIEVAAANRVAGLPLRLVPGDITFGSAQQQQNGRWIFEPGGTDANAVQIDGRRLEDRADGGLPMHFGRMIGRNSIDSQIQSVAAFRKVDIVLVLDRSTSMKLTADSTEGGIAMNDPRFCEPAAPGTRWHNLDEAVRVFLDEVEAGAGGERVALVTFGGHIHPISRPYCGKLPPATLDQDLTRDFGEIHSTLTTLTESVWNGMTDIGAGIELGTQVLTQGPLQREGADKVMLLLTDGQANNDTTLVMATLAAAAGIKISTITFAQQADQLLMIEVAEIGDGIHLHADTREQLVEVFRELAGQGTFIAR
jgi:Ca-activated chloride channel homolog